MDYGRLNFPLSLWMCKAMPLAHFSPYLPPKIYAVLLMFVVNTHIKHLDTLFLLIFAGTHFCFCWSPF